MAKVKEVKKSKKDLKIDELNRELGSLTFTKCKCEKTLRVVVERSNTILMQLEKLV